MAMMEVPVGELSPDPDQPRREFRDAELRELGASLLEQQLVPLIVVAQSKGFLIVDGGRVSLWASRHCAWKCWPRSRRGPS